MKNDIFNFRRFGKYFGTDIRTCWANYGLSLLTLTLLTPVALYVIVNAFNLILESSWDGPDLGLRFAVFCFAMVCLVVTMPVKCYGKLTEKQYGSFWLTLPASRLEKFISMIIITCIIAPLAGILLYIGADALICAIDHTCGRNLIQGGIHFLQNWSELGHMTLNLVDETLTIEDAALTKQLLEQINSPMLYIDEIFGITLPFLLGAIFFKNGKTVKTILALFAISSVSSAIMAPVVESWSHELLANINNDPNVILSMFNNGLFKNLVLLDTISDTVINTAMLVCIWLRIKTLKH